MRVSWRIVVMIVALFAVASGGRAVLGQTETPPVPAPAATPEIPPYWIGLQLEPLPEIVKAQMGLEKGMVVVDVVANSPSAKAGLMKNDLLFQAGDAPIAEVADLLKVVAASKKEPLRLRLLRSGKAIELVVSPEDRPQPVPTEPNNRGAAHLQFLSPQPGVVMAGHPFPVDPMAIAMPEGFTLVMTKHGNQPAEIVVKRKDSSGEKEWKVTSETLGELPREVRTIVEPLVAQSDLPLRWRLRTAPMAAPRLPEAPRNLRELAETETNMQKEFARAANEMREALRSLRETRNIGAEASDLGALRRELEALKAEVEKLKETRQGAK